MYILRMGSKYAVGGGGVRLGGVIFKMAGSGVLDLTVTI